MSQLQSLTVVPGTLYKIQIPTTAKAVKVTNKSYYDLQYSGFGALGSDWIPGGVEYLLYAEVENTGQLSIVPINTNMVSGSPASSILVNIFFESEPVPKGSWPVTIPQSTVSATVSTITNLINDGNTHGTQIIESTPSDAVASTISILNDGTVTIKGDNAGVLTTLLQIIAGATPNVKLGAASILTEILGTLQVDQTSLFTGATTHTGALTANNAGNSILASSIPATGISAGALPVGVTLDGGQITGIISNSPSQTTINGTVTGSVAFFCAIWGVLKVFVLQFVNYQTANVASFNFPSASSRGFWAVGVLPSAQTITFFNGGTAQGASIITGLGTTTVAGGSGVSNNIHGNSIGVTQTTCNQIQVGSNISAAAGAMIYIGV